MNVKRLVIFFGATLVSLQAASEPQYWNAISLSSSVDRFDLFLESEQRMLSAFDDMRTFNVSVGGTTDISEHSNIGLELRWEDKQSGGRWQSENRYSLLFQDSRSYWGYKFGTRVKLESRDKETSYELRARFRLKVSKGFGDWTPYGSVELMYNNSQSYWSEGRYSIGTDYKVTDKFKVSPYYLYRRTTGGADWSGVNVLGTKFSYDF